jgi:hypothetical protein
MNASVMVPYGRPVYLATAGKSRYAERVRQLVYDLVFLAIAAWLLPSGPLAAQSRNELRQKYGEPVSETFIVRPDISVTATFGPGGRITEFLIAPKNTDLIKSRGKSLSADSVNAIIDELVPRSVRGKHLIGGFVNATCLPENDCNGISDSYERVTIYYNAAAEGRVHYAVVQLKE